MCAGLGSWAGRPWKSARPRWFAACSFRGRVATASHVAQVLVQEGARVRRGDVLVQLDADELHAALAQVDARYLDQLAPGQTAAVVADAQAVLVALKAPADSAAATFTNTMGR